MRAGPRPTGSAGPLLVPLLAAALTACAPSARGPEVDLLPWFEDVSSLRAKPAVAEGEAVPARSPEGISLPAATEVGFPLPAADLAEVEVALAPGGGDPGRLRLRVQSGGERRDVGVVAVGRGEVRRRLRVPRLAAPFVRLVVSSEGPRALVLRALRVRSAAPAAPTPSPPSPPARGLSLVLYLSDATRADTLGAHGHPRPTSPRFDAFSRGACLFEQAVAQSSWTRPAVATLFTGLGPAAHGVHGVRDVLAPELTTLAEALRAEGYATGAFVSNPVVSPGRGFGQGFERGAAPGPLARDTVQAALDWLRGCRRPFFAYLHTMGGHRPYSPLPEHWGPLLPATLPEERSLEVLQAKGRLAGDELAYVRSAYEAEVREDDAAFGALLDGLAGLGLAESTVVVFTADHGEAFGEHGLEGHGNSLYEELLHVPLAARVPGVAGRRVGAPVGQADVAPTLLGLAGAGSLPEASGRDLAGVCTRGDAPGEDPVLVSVLRYGLVAKMAVRRGSLKLVVNEEAERPEGRPRLELYDLARDPGEKRDLAALLPEAAGYLFVAGRRRLREETAARAGRTLPVGPAEREQLRALGYAVPER